MKKVLFFLWANRVRSLVTIGLFALMIHWGFFGFLLLSVPTLAVWRNLLP